VLDMPMLASFALAVGSMALLLALRHVIDRVVGRHRGVRTSAHRIADAGEVLAVFCIASATAGGCAQGDDFGDDALRIAVFGASGVVLLLVAGRMGVNLLLRGRLVEEMARGNVAAGVAAGAHSAATGIVVASLFVGSDFAALGVACVFLVVAQATLHLLVALFRGLTVYDDVEEILDENLAAALSYGGVSVAVGVLVAHAADGPYAGWLASLRAYGVALLAGLALYPVRQILVQCFLLGARPTLRGGAIDAAITPGRDVGMGVLEASTYVGTAFMVRAIS
jgi:uncharacterized membrane protein YjfL (UPF0719 family)